MASLGNVRHLCFEPGVRLKESAIAERVVRTGKKTRMSDR
jgi:hypothetical protein